MAGMGTYTKSRKIPREKMVTARKYVPLYGDPHAFVRVLL